MRRAKKSPGSRGFFLTCEIRSARRSGASLRRDGSTDAACTAPCAGGRRVRQGDRRTRHLSVHASGIHSCNDAAAGIRCPGGSKRCYILATGHRTRRDHTRSSGRILRVGFCDRSLHSASESECLGQLRTCRVIVVLRDGDRSQDCNDRDNDHQFDQGKALLVLHFYIPKELKGMERNCCRSRWSHRLSGPQRLAGEYIAGCVPTSPARPPRLPGGNDASISRFGKPWRGVLRWAR